MLWAKDGHLIPSSANHYRVGKFGSLEFSTVGLDDGGVYTCSAENEAGSANRTIELGVQGCDQWFAAVRNKDTEF